METDQMRRRILSVLMAALVLLSGAACRASEAPTVAIFNLVSHPILDESIAGIKEQLVAEGFSGDEVILQEVNAGGDMNALNGFGEELLALNPAVIIPVSTPVAATVIGLVAEDQNVVYSTVTNPSDIGMDATPRNVTGVSDVVDFESNIALIRELFPDASRIGMVYNRGEANSQFGVDRVETLIADLPLELQTVVVANANEVPDAARALAPLIDVFYVGSDNTVASAMPAMTEVAAEFGIPVIASDIGSVENGALAAVSVDYRLLGRRVGEIVAELLRTGADAGTVEPVYFVGDSLVLNMVTASQMGFEFSAAIQNRASKVISP